MNYVPPPRAGAPTISATPATIAPAEFVSDTIVGFRGRDERSRAFNLLRTQLIRLYANGAKVIGVTSATPQVGKTFIACNLAASLSRLPDMQTILYDLDLRRGSVAERFELPVEIGMTEFLLGETDDLANLSWGIEGQRLTMYPTAARRVRSSELLASARFASLVAAMRAMRGDVMHICDLPPVFANDDSMIVNEHIDGYIMVVEDGVTTAKQIRDSLRLLGPEKCFGTILNRYVKGFSGGDYGFGYGKGKAYADYYN
jgi:protein-tyrosine kinase